MNTSNTQYELDAVNLFRSSNTAILSTLSKSTDGYPFGSFVTTVSHSNRELFIYASDIAEHTKNILNDSKACVTLSSVNSQGDKQASSRLSLMGDLTKISSEDIQNCQARFFKFLPESEKYSYIHGFHFYRLKILKARWIGGFGQIGWLDTTHWTAATPDWHDGEETIIQHMNEDHSNVICSGLNGVFGIIDSNAKMFALCTDGYFILSKEAQFFMPFNQPCYHEQDVRAALIKQAKAYRAFEVI
ncbi:MAG: HugZ family protein [Oceanospirillaceae bacterium]